MIPFFGTCNAVTDGDGFTRAKRPVMRPMPRGATLGDFVPTSTHNRFNGMEREAISTTVGSQPARNQPDILTSRAKPVIPSPTISKKQVKKLEELNIKKKTVKATRQKSTPRSVAALDSTLMSCRAKSSVGNDDNYVKEQLNVLENAVLAAINEYKVTGGTVALTGEVDNKERILGGCGGTPDTRYPATAGSVNLVGDVKDDESIPGLDRPFTQEETDDLYRDVKAKVIEDSCNLIFDDDDGDDAEEVVAVAAPAAKVRVGVAADSGATDNVIGLDDLPDGVVPEGPAGPPFSNASGGDIKKYGKVVTLLENADGKVGCGWTACAVTRPLHSVSKVCGPEEGPGVQDFMFNNRIGVVMPPGLVDLLLKHIKPVARYPRRGGLYVGDFEMSSFTRQGPAR
jgi:hypothetical protein